MDKQSFYDLIAGLKELQEKEREISNVGIEMHDIVFDKYHSVINLLLREVFPEKFDWVEWFCYENSWGEGSLKATDNGKPICFDIESLYKYINKK